MKPSLADKKFVATRQGKIAYLEAGAADAPAALLVHGIPTSSYLFRHVMRHLSGAFRLLAPDLMGLGDTEVDPARTDFAMPAQAEMLEDFLDAVGVPCAHLVAHDQGGAAAQILACQRPGRVDRLVLTDCVCFDNWPVPAVRTLQRFARLPFADLVCRTGLMEWKETRTSASAFRRGVVDRAALDDATIAEYLRPLRGTADERARFLAFLRAGSPRHTLAVVPRLAEYKKATLVLWAREDTYIPLVWGRRLYETIPGAVRFEVVDGAGHFWPEERPEPFAERILAFLAAPSVAVAASAGARSSPGLVEPGRLARPRCKAATELAALEAGAPAPEVES
ncbi:MAG: alpha/beta hydrolase [Polyangiaceae bacterium]|nr:alpha/beta hydrolase [Polyangiaceae bacterium]